MPNWVTNNLEITGEKERIRELAEFIAVEKNGKKTIGTIDFTTIIPMPKSLDIESGSRSTTGLRYYSEFVNYYLASCENRKADDEIPAELEEKGKKKILRKLIREKAHKYEIDNFDELWSVGKICYHNVRLYGYPTWYEWCINNWGTKWNAEYCCGNLSDTKLSISFETAWNAPLPVIEKLAELFPDVDIVHEWADEDIGYNCGGCKYANGQETMIEMPDGTEAAIRFACNVWGYSEEEYLEEFSDEEK